MTAAARASSEAPRIAVVGAGVSGLAAALRLVDRASENGRRLSVTVFDPAPPGGACRTLTEEHAGETVVREMGPDSFLSRPPHLVALCERLGLGGELIGTNPSPRGALVWTERGTERVPEGFTLLAPSRWGPTLRSPTLSPVDKLRLMTEPLRRRGPAARGEDESVASFVRRRLGRGVLDRLAQPLAAGIYAGDAERLSLVACLPQFAADERARGRITGKKPGGGATADGGARYSLFVTPRDGLGTIATAAVHVLTEAGVTLRAEPVSAIRRDGGRWRVYAGDADSRFDAVVLAVPARVAAELVRDQAVGLSGELAAVEYSSSLIVNTLHRVEDVRHPLDAFGLVIPDRLRSDRGQDGGAGLSAFAVSFASRKFPGRAPAGWVQIRTFLGGVNRAGCVSRDRDEVLDAARLELARLLAVTWREEVAANARLARWDQAMPQYNLGHLDRVARITGLLDDQPGLELAGNSLHGVGLPAAVGSGTAAADRILAALSSR